MTYTPYIITPENAEQVADWLRNRGGIAIWVSLDLQRPGWTKATPAMGEDGQPTPQPDWWLSTKPVIVITDIADVVVSNDVEVERFHVALRMGDGLSIRCTDGASRNIRRATAKAGGGAYHVFDYGTQDAVIMKPESQVPLAEYLKPKGKVVEWPSAG